MPRIQFYFVFLILLFLTSEAFAIEFSAHGYYRTRFEYTHDLDLQRPSSINGGTDDRFGTIAFGQQRFRINPDIKLNDHLSFHGQIDMLDNLLFGQSQVSSLEIANPITGTIALPQANGPFGVIATTSGDPLAGGGGNIEVRRVYVDILTSGGKLRIGRQPSNWGLGILTNDGDGPEGNFGDTFDRILYLAGLYLKNGDRINFGLSYDMLFDASQDPTVSGLDTLQGSSSNDAMQGAALILYQSDNYELGTFSGIRFRNGDEGATTTTATCVDTTDSDGDGSTVDGVSCPSGVDGNTFIYFFDLYGRFNFAHHYRIGFEGAYFGGKIAPGIAIDAVILDDATAQGGLTNPLPTPITLPQNGTQNDLAAGIAALEGDAWWDFGGEAHIQAGFASGDSSPLSQRITQLGFRPDYNIALMMFSMPLGTSPAIRVGGITELGLKPVTPNYINDAIYATLQYKQGFDITSGVPWAQDFKIGAKVISAWAPSRILDIDFSQITGIAGLPHVVNNSRWYGFEVDLSAEATFFDFMHWSTVVGAFIPGGIYDIRDDNESSNGSTIINPINPDTANISVAAKTTFIFDF